jgi:conjugal transfer pilus assembly protein TraW
VLAETQEHTSQSIDEVVRELIEDGEKKKLDPASRQEIKSILEEAQAPADVIDLIDWMDEAPTQALNPNPDVEQSIDGLVEAAGFDSPEGFLGRAREALQRSPGNIDKKTSEPIFALITLGLGREVILNYFREAEGLGAPVVFVLRGFDPDQGGLQALVEKIMEINQLEIPFSMHINPTMFEQTESERVPVFLRKGEDGVMRIRRGAVNLHAAKDALSRDEMDVVVGETFPIAEPNLLAVIHERIENFDGGEEIVEAARERVRERFSQAPEQLPESDSDRTYFVDPSITLTRDITLPEGQVVAYEGTRVNPLEVAPWDMQVVVIDATSDWQVEQAMLWSQNAHLRTIFLATRKPNTPQGMEQLGHKLQDHVHLVDELVVRRMDLQAVPSRVQQDGLQVRVDVVARGVER